MKKLLFILVAILSLCACSSSDEESINNTFTLDGKSYQIDDVTLSIRGVMFHSGEYTLNIYNCDYEVGKKNYLSAFKNAEALVMKGNGWYGDILYSWDRDKIKEDSYVTVKENDDDNRTYVEAYINDGKKIVKAKYLGTPKVD